MERHLGLIRSNPNDTHPVQIVIAGLVFDELLMQVTDERFVALKKDTVAHSYRNAGCVNKYLMVSKNAHQTKPTFGKWSSLHILQQQLSLYQSKVKNGNILK